MSSPNAQRGVMAQRPGPVESTIAPYTSRTSLLIFGGILLIVVNLLMSNFGVPLLKAAGVNITAPVAGQGGPDSWLDIILQVVGLGLLVLIASVDDAAGSFALLFLAALWLGWIFSHRAWFGWIAGLANATNPSSNNNNSSSGQK